METRSSRKRAIDAPPLVQLEKRIKREDVLAYIHKPGVTPIQVVHRFWGQLPRLFELLFVDGEDVVDIEIVNSVRSILNCMFRHGFRIPYKSIQRVFRDHPRLELQGFTLVPYLAAYVEDHYRVWDHFNVEDVLREVVLPDKPRSLLKWAMRRGETQILSRLLDEGYSFGTGNRTWGVFLPHVFLSHGLIHPNHAEIAEIIWKHFSDLSTVKLHRIIHHPKLMRFFADKGVIWDNTLEPKRQHTYGESVCSAIDAGMDTRHAFATRCDFTYQVNARTIRAYGFDFWMEKTKDGYLSDAEMQWIAHTSSVYYIGMKGTLLPRDLRPRLYEMLGWESFALLLDPV